MNDSQQLREQIWDFVYGLLSEQEGQTLIALIKSDPQVARIYTEVRLQADLVSQAARIQDASLTLDTSAVDIHRQQPRDSSAKTGAIGRQARARLASRWASLAHRRGRDGTGSVDRHWLVLAVRRSAANRRSFHRGRSLDASIFARRLDESCHAAHRVGQRR